MADALSELAEAVYEGVRFPVEVAPTQGGNDFAEHTAYLRRGADMEPTGLRAYKGTLSIPLINTGTLVARYGELFPGLRFDLLNTFQTTPRGQLSHPTFGVLTVAITDWSERLTPDQRNGVMLDVSWVEHNGSASLLVGTDGQTPANTPTTVSEAATDADAKMAAVGSGYTPVKDTIDEQLVYLGEASRSYSEVADAFRKMLAPVDANIALPLFSAASAHAATVSLLNLRAALFDFRSRYAPVLTQVRYYTVPVPMAVWEIAVAVYGDASKDGLIYAANSFSDPLLVNAGRVLTILPL